ncbi:hypothetical protein GCM10009859_24600 [Kocuria salsicia]|uniref:arylamine N-acetyltransferase family protein n=1 Tax=Kocuria salsicia TaxID=664639 RepID=UPI0031DD3189
MTHATAQEWQIDAVDVPAYLAALGVEPASPSLDLLEHLHRAHVSTFPFSNVEVLLGEHPGVEPATVFDQVVVRRRGGYCFEHSQLFSAALQTLGFTVRRALGRVRSLQSARTHMTVLVDLDGARYLCDPGFGFNITGPIALDDGARRVEGGVPSPWAGSRTRAGRCGPSTVTGRWSTCWTSPRCTRQTSGWAT